jgi:hypothetical protein
LIAGFHLLDAAIIPLCLFSQSFEFAGNRGWREVQNNRTDERLNKRYHRGFAKTRNSHLKGPYEWTGGGCAQRHSINAEYRSAEAVPAASASHATAPGLPSARQREKLRLASDDSGRILDLILPGVPAMRVRWSANATAGVIIEKRDCAAA